MSTSDTLLRRDLPYLLAGTVFLALFGAVYEHFSHGVYSYYMIYAFAVPLILGVVPCVAALAYQACPPPAPRRLWNAGIAVLSVGSVMRGVLDIYGTTNALIAVYGAVGCVLLGLAALRMLFFRRVRGIR